MTKIKYPTKNKKTVTKCLAEILEAIDTQYTILNGKIVIEDNKLMDESDIEILNGLAETINISIQILKSEKV